MHLHRPCAVACAVFLVSLPVESARPQDTQEGTRSELERGLQFRKQGRRDTAITIFRRALKRNPQSPMASELLFEIGQTQYEIGKSKLDSGAPLKTAEPTLEEALATFQSVVDTYPDSRRAASATYMSGSTYTLLEEHEKALRAYQTTVARYPDYVARSRALLRAGMVLASLDRVPEGMAVLEKVTREFPDRKGDVQVARKYLHQLGIVGQKAAPVRAHTWLNNLVDGSGLASFEGEVVVLVFLATWCSSCSEEIPHLRRIITKWSDKGVVFLAALNPKDPMNTEPVDVYVERAELDFLDVGLVEDPRPWSAYRTERLPAAVVIDRHGIIRWRGHPALFPGYLVARALTE